MQNVTINNKKFGVDGDTPVKLNNGSIVLHYNKLCEVIGAYMVTSFRDNKNKYKGAQTTTYCSLIDLDSGYIKFEERCSRGTTIKRVLSHLMGGEYLGEQAVKSGHYIEVYGVGDYKIDLQLKND